MKKVLFALVIILGISAAANAQKPAKMKLKDGVMMVDNKPMLYKHGKYTTLTQTYTCTDGCKISTDGTITKPDGSVMKLMNGYEIDKDGKVAMIPHGQKGHVCGPDCPMMKKSK
jgi:hypothetical protein